MSSSKDHSLDVPLLSDENYPQWSRRMACLLLSKDLADIVGFNPTTLAPLDDAPTITTNEHKKADAKAKARITMRLSDDTLATAQSAQTAHELWKLLHTTYQRSSMAAVVSCLKKLISIVKSPSQTISSYIADIQTKSLSLRNAGVKLQDKLVVALILANLPDDYSEVTTAIDVLDEVSIAKATSMLLNAEISMSERLSTSSISANHVRSMESEIEALKEKVRQLECSKPKNSCSISWHTHSGGDAACYAKHPELRKLNSTKTSKVALYSCHDACTSLEVPESNETIADTGSSTHMFRERVNFSSYSSAPNPNIRLGDSSVIHSLGKGRVEINLSGRAVELNGAVHVPKLSKNLFSVGQSTGTGAKFVFDGDYMLIYAREGFTPARGHLIAKVRKSADNLYRMSCSQPNDKHQPSAHFTTQKGAVTRKVWHERLGHLNSRALDQLLNASEGIKIKSSDTEDNSNLCEPCIMSKMTRFPFLPTTPKTTHPGELVHSDLKGPFKHPAIDGPWRYFVTYVDYHTRFTKVFLLEHKRDQLRAFRIYEATITNKFNSPVRTIESFQSDNGGEYMSKAVQDYFEAKGINHRRTVPYNPESNGIAERINRTIMETSEALRTQC